MKKLLFLFVVLVSTILEIQAQQTPVNKGLSFGFQLNQYQRDFGFGLNVTSPHFLNEKLAVRMRGNLMYFEHPKNEEITWTPYSNLTLGLIGIGGYVNERIKLYGEGGLIVLFPSQDFSNDETAYGGYGLFGFEFYMHDNANYFIELGSVGTGAKATKLPLQPMYSNGFAISTGFRICLK